MTRSRVGEESLTMIVVPCERFSIPLLLFVRTLSDCKNFILRMKISWHFEFPLRCISFLISHSVAIWKITIPRQSNFCQQYLHIYIYDELKNIVRETLCQIPKIIVSKYPDYYFSKLNKMEVLSFSSRHPCFFDNSL